MKKSNPRTSFYFGIYGLVMLTLIFINSIHSIVGELISPNFTENSAVLLRSLIWNTIYSGVTVAWIFFVFIYEMIKTYKK